MKSLASSGSGGLLGVSNLLGSQFLVCFGSNLERLRNFLQSSLLLEFLCSEHLLVVGFFNLLLLKESSNFSLLRLQLDNSSLVISSILLGLLDLLSLKLKFSITVLSLCKCVLLLHGRFCFLNNE